MIVLFINLVIWAAYTYLFSFISIAEPWFWICWVMLGFLATVITFLLLIYCVLLPIFLCMKPTNRVKHFIADKIFNFILVMCRIRVKFEGRENLVSRSEGQTVFVANHKSMLDPFFIYKMTKRPLTVLSKSTLRKLKFLVPLLDTFQVIPINRQNDREAAKSMIQAIKVVRGGCPIMFFPEGGIKTREVEQMVALRAGVYKLPQKSEATIQPFAIFGASKLKGRPFYKFSTITVRALKPVKYEDYQNMNTHEIGELIIEQVNREFINEKRHTIDIQQ